MLRGGAIQSTELVCEDEASSDAELMDTDAGWLETASKAVDENGKIYEVTILYKYENGTCESFTCTISDDGYAYLDMNNDGKTIAIVYYVGDNWGLSDTDITIPSKIDGYTVTEIYSYAFNGCNSVTSVVIPNTVTTIKNKAFYVCLGLTSITIPDSVTSIGSGAFSYCTSLKKIKLTGTNKNYAVKNNVLYNKAMTKLMCCPGGKTGSFSIPTTVTKIDDAAFTGCEKLESITIPKKVTDVGGNDYYASAFSYMYNLTSITVDSGNKNYASDDGILYNKKKTKLICCPAGKSGSFTISSNVTSVADGAFAGCTGLTSVTIPDGVTSIGVWSFHFCTSLKSITISDSVESIGKYAFCHCTSLKSVIIPDSITTLSNGIFSGCTSLKSIAIPNTVTSIEDGAFASCSKLVDIYYTGTAAKWAKISLGTNWNINCPSDMTIHYSSVVKGSTVTVNNYKYKVTKVSTGSNGTVTVTKIVTKKASVKIPATIKINGKKYKVTAVAKNAFKGNTKMTSLVIGSNVKTIGANAFYGCTKLKKVTIGKSVKKIAAKAFYNCKKLSSVTIKSTKLKTSNVGAKAFSKTKSTVKIKVPKSKKSAYKKMLLKKGVSNKATIS